MIYELKREQKFFGDIAEGRMSFIPTEGDKNYRVGDVLVIKEFFPGEWEARGAIAPGDSRKPTGRVIRRKVTYVFEGSPYGIAPGAVVLGLEEY